MVEGTLVHPLHSLFGGGGVAGSGSVVVNVALHALKCHRRTVSLQAARQQSKPYIFSRDLNFRPVYVCSFGQRGVLFHKEGFYLQLNGCG
jgi:hypothetical protein